MFGEIKLSGGSGTQQIPLADSIAVDSVVYAGPQRGDDPELARVCRSTSFLIPTSPYISFFRLLVTDNGMGQSMDTSVAKHLGWHITDTTIFRTLLVRDSDNQVLQTLDSIVVLPKLAYEDGDRRFGTDPQHIFKTVAMSSAYVGTVAHVTVLPSWYGYDTQGSDGCACCPNSPNTITAAHGMSAAMLWGGLNYTAMLDSLGRFATSDSLQRIWSFQKYTQLIAYQDSILAATGCVELPLPLGFDSVAQDYRYHTHIGEVAETLATSGQVYWTSAHCVNPAPGLSKRSLDFHRIGNAQIVTLQSRNPIMIVSAQRSSDLTTLRVTLQSQNKQFGIRVAVASLVGRTLGAAWKGDIAAGSTTLDLRLPPATSEAYLLYVLDSQSTISNSYKLIFVK